MINDYQPVCGASTGQLFSRMCPTHKKNSHSSHSPFGFFAGLLEMLEEPVWMHKPYFVCVHKFFESGEYFLNILKLYEYDQFYKWDYVPEIRVKVIA